MKSMKIVLASLFLTAGIITLSSFAGNYNKSAFATVCYEYVIGNGTLTEAKAELTTNWATVSDVPAACPQTNFLCAICFDDTQFAGTPAQRKQAALDILGSYLTSVSFVLPTDGATITHSGKNITVYQRAQQ